MIKINLALKKSASLVGEPGAEGGTSATSFTRLTQMDLKNIRVQDLASIPKLKEIIILVVFWYGASYGKDYYFAEEVRKMEEQVAELKAKEADLKKALEEVKKFESVKIALEGDERIVRSKLETIEKLAQDRAGPPRILLALSSALPRDVWLADLRVDTAEVLMRGDAIDFGPISDFVKGLNESVVFKEVNLKSSQLLRDETGRDAYRFELSVRRR